MSSQFYTMMPLHRDSKTLTKLYKALYYIVPSFSPTHVISPSSPNSLPSMLGIQFLKHIQILFACRYFYICILLHSLCWDTFFSFFAWLSVFQTRSQRIATSQKPFYTKGRLSPRVANLTLLQCMQYYLKLLIFPLRNSIPLCTTEQEQSRTKVHSLLQNGT